MSVVYSSIEKVTEEESGETCSICRKKLKLNEVVIQCSSCKTFYHYKHLLDWLKNDPGCPVCRNNMIILDSEDKNIDTTDSLNDDTFDIAKIDGMLENDNNLIFFNPNLKPKISSIFAQCLILIIGLLLYAIIISVAIEHFRDPYPYLDIWLFLTMILVPYIGNLFVIYIGLTKDTLFISSNWQNTVMKENLITISNKRKPNLIEIIPTKVVAVYSDIFEDELEIEEEILDDLYCIRLEIVLENKKKYHFKKFFSSTSSSNTKSVLLKIEEYFKENYSIDISPITEEEKKRRERIRILYIFIGAIFLVWMLFFFSGFAFIF